MKRCIPAAARSTMASAGPVARPRIVIRDDLRDAGGGDLQDRPGVEVARVDDQGDLRVGGQTL